MPSQVASSEARWKRVRSPYDLRRPENHFVESVDASGPLTVVTSGKPWHYAVGFRYQLPWYDRSCRNTRVAIVRLRASVTQGEISVGLANEAQNFLDESIRKPGEGPNTIDLLAGNLADARWLIVRDGGEPGGPSRIVIERISVYRIPPLARGAVHVNTAESFNGLFKRSIQGAWHHISREHIARYLNEQCFRWSHRKIDDGARTLAALARVAGVRLYYKQPMQGQPSGESLVAGG